MSRNDKLFLARAAPTCSRGFLSILSQILKKEKSEFDKIFSYIVINHSKENISLYIPEYMFRFSSFCLFLFHRPQLKKITKKLDLLIKIIYGFWTFRFNALENNENNNERR